MMEVNPLWLIIGIEAIILFAGVSVYLGYHLFLISRKKTSQAKELLNAIDVNLEILKEKILRAQERDTESAMRKKGLELEVRIVEALRDSLERGIIDKSSFNASFSEKSHKAIEEFINWFRNFTDRKDEIIAKARAALKERNEALNKLQEVLKKKKAQIIELVEKLQKNEGAMKKLQILRENNQRLKAMIAQLSEKAKEAEHLKEVVAALEATNRDLTVCIEILEQENERLNQQLSQMQEMMKLFEDSEQIFDRLQKEQGLKDLLLDLKEKDEEIKRLKRELQTLEKEYMNLYEKMIQMNKKSRKERFSHLTTK